MKMIAHQTIAVQLKGLSLVEIQHCLKERLAIAVMKEHVLSIVATVHNVVDQASGDGTKWSGHSVTRSNPEQIANK